MTKFKVKCPFCGEWRPGTWQDVVDHRCEPLLALQAQIRERLKS